MTKRKTFTTAEHPHMPRKFVDGVEMVVTPLDELEASIAWDDPENPHQRSAPITEKDIEEFPHLRGYLGGCMVTPRTRHFDVSTPEGKAKQRAAEQAWSLRAVAMHDAQVPITVADKPQAIVPKYHETQTRRGD